MQRFIVVPLYDHTTEEEAAELATDLERTFGLALRPYLAEAETFPVDVELQRTADELGIAWPL